VPDRLHVRKLSTPTPRVLYIHDDLTAEVTERHGADSEAARVATELLDLVRADGRVIVLTLAEQIEALVERGAHAPFALALGIGGAGERVARAVHARTGWFPAVRRVDVTREEQEGGGYRIVSTVPESLDAQLAGVTEAASLALVDDTVFSGLTMRSIVVALPEPVRRRMHAFCLRAVDESLATIRPLCPVSAGVAAPGRILEDVSFINASGLARPGAIRRAGAPPLAFFEREEWMRAWFPGYTADVTRLCRRLSALLGP
jgi:hypothetical protein